MPQKARVRFTVSTEKCTTVDEADIYETMLSQNKQNGDLPSSKVSMMTETGLRSPGEILSSNLNNICLLINLVSIFNVFFRLCRFDCHTIEFVDFLIFDHVVLGTID